MDYLSRQSAPFDEALWASIDETVVSVAKETLVGRRFLPFFGPVGPGLNAAEVLTPQKEEILADGFATLKGRDYKPVPQLYEDFWLYWRDIENSRQLGYPLDLSAVRQAAQNLALREDKMIFYGVPALGLEGLVNAKGINKQKLSDWSSPEAALMDVAQALATLTAKGFLGRRALLLSPDLYVTLHRLAPNTGVMELDRIKSMLDNRVYSSHLLEVKTAVLVCAQAQNLDLMVGQDISTAYTELVDLNHHLRILETAILRIKQPQAIVLFK